MVGTPVPGSPTQQAFRLGDAATAVLDTANGQLTVVSVTPHPGWALDRAEQEDSTSVEIRLESATGEVRFEASLVRGVVVVSLRSEAETSSTSSTPNTGVDDDGNSGPGTGDDDNSGSGSSGSGSSGSGSSGSGSSGSGSSGSGSGSDDD